MLAMKYSATNMSYVALSKRDTPPECLIRPLGFSPSQINPFRGGQQRSYLTFDSFQMENSSLTSPALFRIRRHCVRYLKCGILF